MIWSEHQEAIYSAVAANEQHLMCNSVAGSGKTVTGTEAIKRAPGRTKLAVAYNIAAKDNLRVRLPEEVDVRTFHSLGNERLRETCKRFTIDKDKYYDLIGLWLRDHERAWRDAMSWRDAHRYLQQLTDYKRLTFGRTVGLAAYDLAHDPVFWEAALQIIERGDSIADEDGIIDYTDQLWLPYSWKLPAAYYDYVLVDEVQDLSPAARHLVMSCVKPENGRLLGLGDPKQSISLWCYAALHSFELTRDTLAAKELPLSVSYRCPLSHVALAQELVPQIQAREGAPEGHIEHVEWFTDVIPQLRRGALVICRTNQPLIAAAASLIKRRIAAKVRGREIGRGITGFVSDSAEAFGWDSPERSLEQLRDQKLARVASLKRPAELIQGINDTWLGAQACVEGFYDLALNKGSLLQAIQGLFSDEGSAEVWLSSVHRAKGLEADDVAILGPSALEGAKARTKDQAEQEANLKYVALTRSREKLFFVGE